MSSNNLTSSINIRLSEPVYKHLKVISKEADMKIAQLVRKAIKQTYGIPKTK